MDFDVFISYSSKDKPVGDAVCAALENDKIRCWMAPRDVRPGTPYAEALIDAIDNCVLMVLVFSENSNTSPQVQREVERAIAKGKPIIPLRIKDVPMTKSMEYYLSVPHWLDALTPPLERHLRYLSETISVMLAKMEPARRGNEQSSREATPGDLPSPGKGRTERGAGVTEGSRPPGGVTPVDRDEDAAALTRRAYNLYVQQDYDGAMACNEQVERYCRSKGDTFHLAMTLGDQALILEKKESWEAALARCAEAAELWHKLGDNHRLQKSMRRTAEILVKLGQPRTALEVLRKCEGILRRRKDNLYAFELAQTLTRQAEILFELEGPKEALPLAESAYAIAADPANKSTACEKLAAKLSDLLQTMRRVR